MLNAKASQFTLGDDGQISFQPDASNPVPGKPVAKLSKGKNILRPGITMLADAPAEGQAAVETWLGAHIVGVLEPLVALPEGEMTEAVKGIAAKVFDAMGIVPREQLEELISKLDQETRRELRTKKVRLGPILVFQPDLNKPAAVRLRALLWSLYNDKPLPAAVPKDGVVSFAVDEAAIDKSFYQAIGYPVYGGRAIRIDMLDRVISAVYDGAEGGKFKAEHKMAEWLGSSIDGLYAVLEAMGHKKVHDPAEAVAAAAEGLAPETAEAKPEEGKPQPQVKPELATFRLKKGKAFEKEAPKGKSAKKKDAKGEKDTKKKGGKRNKSTNRTPKIMSAGPEKRPEDSPFAILQQLKMQGGGKKDAG